jgi:hypothetical protein
VAPHRIRFLALALLCAAAPQACVASTLGKTENKPSPEAVAAVRVAVLEVPTGAVELGQVEATSDDGLEAAYDLFRERVAALGGNQGKVDRSSSLFRRSQRGYMERCGWTGKVRHCKSFPRFVEGWAVKLEGRAFRVDAPPDAQVAGGP